MYLWFAAKKKRHRRRRRHEQFLGAQGGTQIPISHNLVQAAHLLLVKALEERKSGVWRTKENHATWYAPGVILTVTTALDAWLNEVIGSVRMTGSIPDEQIAVLIDRPLYEKYREAARTVTGRRVVPKDLKLLETLRHEIVHFLPYVQDIASGKTVPDWLDELSAKMLLISTGDPKVEFHLSQKLCSYALAYWACEIAHVAAEDFKALYDKHQLIGPILAADNFAFFQQLAAPKDLGQFDKQYGLNLTG